MTGSLWVASYLLLWVTVVALGVTVVALLRQIGILHTRIAPMGIHFAGEGPELDQPAPTVDGLDYRRSAVTVMAFTSPTCEICASLRPVLDRVARSYREVTLRTVDNDAEPELFAPFRVRSTPYLVAIDGEGIVRSRGVANTGDQVEEMLAEVLANLDDDASGASPVAAEPEVVLP